ncbi:MAG: hypothetical protein AAGJ35_14520 [Myxococcota bacterium]
MCGFFYLPSPFPQNEWAVITDKATVLGSVVLRIGVRFLESELQKIKPRGFGVRSSGLCSSEMACAMKAVARFAEVTGEDAIEKAIGVLSTALGKGGQMGISAGKRLIELSRYIDSDTMTRAYEQVLMLSESKEPDVRLKLVQKVGKELWRTGSTKRLPARWCVAFPLAIDDTVDKV